MRPKTRLYTSARIPPRIYTPDVEIDRKNAGKICEQLGISIKEYTGAAMYVPEIAEGKNTCRFEFHYWSRKYKTEYRLGIMVTVHRQKATLSAYITTPECIAFKDATHPVSVDIPTELQPRLWKRIQKIYKEAEKRVLDETGTSSFHLFFMKVPHGGGYAEKITLEDITVYPTLRIGRDDIMSPVIVRAESAHDNSALTVANYKFQSFCALNTVAYGQPFKRVYPTIPAKRKSKPIKSLAPDLSDFLRVKYQFVPRFASKYAAQRTDWIAEIIKNCPVADFELFMRAVYAYSAGAQVEVLKTLAVVAHAAAMSALANEFKSECTGASSCSICGSLQGHHNLVGEGKAILQLVQSTRDLDKTEITQAKKLINAVYSKQRSSYVHAAELRHNEDNKDQVDISLTPSETRPAQDIYYFENDAQNFARLTRHTIIRWISQRSNVNYQPEHLNMTATEVISHTGFVMDVSLRARVEAVMDFF